jgi:predicted acyl esterase
MERDSRFSTTDVPYYTHRQSTPLSPGRIYEIEVPLEPIAYRFRKGSWIRLEIANGDSTVTDGLFFHFYRPDKVGSDAICHDAVHPSELILPVLKID